MGKFTPLDFNKYAALARQAAAEGCVLLKNENEALPLRKGDKVAVFGRIAFHYYKSGLGSGGLVNTKYVVGILDALKEEKDITLDENLLGTYEKWIEKNPYDEGQGWGKVPWSQKEMELTDEIVESAKGADAAIVVVGRTAGEDQDNKNEAGSYLLTDTEKEMVEKVSKAFARTIVVLNVGNIIDMKWVKECNPAAVLYVWQGGQEGGNGVCDVLTGRVNPCGKLTDTIAERIEDYPCTANFGDAKRNYYKEDIYVGYRYFETFAKDKVIYPFGYGLSYTTFSMESVFDEQKDSIEIKTTVKNTGDLAGKEVVRMGTMARHNVELSIAAMEDMDSRKIAYVLEHEPVIDALEEEVTKYLTQMSETQMSRELSARHTGLLHACNDIERIGDHGETLAKKVRMIYEDNVKFSDEAKAELHTLGQMVLEASGKALEALEKDDKKLAEEAWALCRQVKQYQKEIRKNHIVRLNEKRCDPVAGFVMLELLINMKRVSDHSKNISQLVLGIF